MKSTWGEESDILDEWLLTQVLLLLAIERYAATREHRDRTYLLVDDEVVSLHKGVFTVVYCLHIGVELYTEEYDDHTYEVSKEESC